MSDRLKQIWGRFEGATTRKLTGGGVDHIPVPEREGRPSRKGDAGALPQAPSTSAMAALKDAIREDAMGGGKRRRRGAPAPTAAFAEREPAPTDLIAPETQGDGAPLRDFRADVAETARRIVRTDADYLKYATAKARAELEGGKRRKRFIFF